MIATILTIIALIIFSPYIFMLFAPAAPLELECEVDVMEYAPIEYCLVDGELIEYSLN